MFTRAPNTLTRVYAARMDSLTSQDHTPQMNIAQRRNWIPPPPSCGGRAAGSVCGRAPLPSSAARVTGGGGGRGGAAVL